MKKIDEYGDLAKMIQCATVDTLVKTILDSDDLDMQFFFLLALAEKDEDEAREVFKFLIEES